MAKPIFHAINSARKFGGQPEDYQKIHCKMDSSKSCYPKMAHRLVFHHQYGHKLIQDFLGTKIVNSENNTILVKDVANQHTFEDLGFIPTLENYSQEFEESHPLLKKIWPSVGWHTIRDVRHWGGKAADYQHIHQKMYEPGPSPAGTAIFHSSFGVYLIEELFGIYFKNSSGRVVSVRDVAEQHVLRMFRAIPTLGDWLEPINKPWMAGLRKAKLVLVD